MVPATQSYSMFSHVHTYSTWNTYFSWKIFKVNAARQASSSHTAKDDWYSEVCASPLGFGCWVYLIYSMDFCHITGLFRSCRAFAWFINVSNSSTRCTYWSAFDWIKILFTDLKINRNRFGYYYLYGTERYVIAEHDGYLLMHLSFLVFSSGSAGEYTYVNNCVFFPKGLSLWT